jgi:hypothetical protein
LINGAALFFQLPRSKRTGHIGGMNLNIRNCLLIACVAALFAGCKPEPKTGSDVSHQNSYTLVSVNGTPVPCTVQHGGRAVTVKAGQFFMGADQTCSTKTIFSLPKGEDVTREAKATFKQDGSKLIMKWKGAGTTTGHVDGATFTMNNEGIIFAYRK